MNTSALRVAARVALVALSLGLLMGAWAQAPAGPALQSPVAGHGQRLALVIGNATYKHQSVLRNTVNDARAFSQALRESGFTVIAHENADQRTMLLALREFGDRLRGGGTGLFYFSGHGMQIKGRNYLVPVDAAFEREDEIAYRTVDAQAVLDKMEVAGNASNIMILDACRTNPFVRSTRSGQQGLAPMDAPLGTLIAYATAPGTVASDGTGINGLYTHHLLEAMRHPGMKVEDVFKLVRGNVRRESGGTQIPWEATSLEGDFYFKLNTASVAPEQLETQLPRPVASAPADALELALWELVRNSTVSLEIAAYVNRYPNGLFAAAARARLAALGAGPPIAQGPAFLATPPSAHAGAKPEPMANATGFVSGDRWRFQVVDKFKGEVVRNYSNVVDAVLEDGSMVLNGGKVHWDPRGNARSIDSGDTQESYTDYVTVPPSLQAGARTSINYKVARKDAGGRFQDEAKGTMIVRRQESVVTPAGTFQAWRVEVEVWGYTRGAFGEQLFGSLHTGIGGWRRTTTGWYVPELRNYVAFEEETRTSTGYQNSSTSTFSVRERHELTSFSVRGAENLAQR